MKQRRNRTEKRLHNVYLRYIFLFIHVYTMNKHGIIPKISPKPISLLPSPPFETFLKPRLVKIIMLHVDINIAMLI